MSSIDWDAKWQGHQEIMSTLAGAGNDVLFIENTGVRAPTAQDWPRLCRRVRNASRGRYGLRTEQERLLVHSPILFPFPYSQMARRVNRLSLARVCRRWTGRVGHPHPILWVFLPTPILGDLIRALQPELIVYYCVDDLASSSTGASRIRESEDDLLRTADLVFVTTESLRARAAKCRDQVDVFPPGVRAAEFDRARENPIEIPADIRELPRPVVGYLGGINQKMDQALLAAVARRLPQIQFALVGPVQATVFELADCQNVHILGYRPHADVSRYLKGVSLGLIPYRITPYTSHVYPAKLNEYLAMGLPVVATPLPELHRFNALHGEIVTIADGVEAFCAAVCHALDDTSPSRVEQRVAIARGNRWDLRITAMMNLVADALTDTRLGSYEIAAQIGVGGGTPVVSHNAADQSAGTARR